MEKIKTRLCSALNITVPIIQAPIGVAVTAQFASTVSNYAALGVVPLGTIPPEKCDTIRCRIFVLGLQFASSGIRDNAHCEVLETQVFYCPDRVDF